MRMSCNGCRVLRKGCSEDCTLRPCLQWIKSPESQANATLFLAKFYGRAGLINLINAGPTDVRPAIFRSLLYEACGRIINPVHGSIGLMSSGNWQRCQAAVEAVLKGSPLIMPGSRDGDASLDDGGEPSVTPLKLCDIRHLSKAAAASGQGNRIRKRFKRTAAVKNQADAVAAEFTDEAEAKFTITGWDYTDGNKGFDDYEESRRAPSHESGSVETTESGFVNPKNGPVWVVKPEPHESCEIGLELTLGLNSLIEISDSEA